MSRYLLALLCLIAAIVIFVKPANADVVADFNDGTLQGWIPKCETNAVASTTGGNPDGYLKMTDTVTSLDGYFSAPVQFLGNWHAMTSVSADIMKLSGGTKKVYNVMFMISGPGGTCYRDFGQLPTTSWQTYSTLLDPTLWTCESGNWNAVLDNVTMFAILMDFVSGTEANGLDNVRLVSTTNTSDASIESAKQQADGKAVQISGVVSRVVDGGFYMQSPDSSSGIYVSSSLVVNEGDSLVLTGKMATYTGERYLKSAVLVSSTPGVAPSPVFVLPGDFGGVGVTSFDPKLGTSITEKETGLLVSTSGLVTKIDDEGNFTISDSSGTVYGGCVPAVAAPIPGAYVTAVGLSSSTGPKPYAPLIGIAKDEFTYSSLPLGQNLIRNGGGEEGATGSNGVAVRPLAGWTAGPAFTVTNYGYIYPTSESTRINGGKRFFFGGIAVGSALATQDIDVSSLAAQIDGGGLTVKLSGDLGGRDAERDTAVVNAVFYSKTDEKLGTLQIGPQAGTGQNTWNYFENTTAVPAKTRCIRVQMIGTRIIGSNCDCFFDNLSLILQ